MKRIDLLLLIMGIILVIGVLSVSKNNITGMAFWSEYNNKPCNDVRCSDYLSGTDCALDTCNKVCFFEDSCKGCTKDSTCSLVTNKDSCNANPCGLSCIWHEDSCKDSIYGNYFVKPHFAIDIDYDFKEYEKLSLLHKEIENKCSQENNIESCAKSIILSEGTFIQDESCSKEDDLLSKISTQYLDCLQSYESNCVCEIKIPDIEKEMNVLLKTLYDENNHAIEKTLFAISDPGIEQYEDINYEKSEIIDFSANYWMVSKNQNSIFQDMVINITPGKNAVLLTNPGLLESSEKWELSESYLLLRTHNNNMHPIVTFIKPDLMDDFSNYPICKLRTERIIPLCLSGKEKVIDIVDNKIEKNPVVYKLAFEISDSSPPQEVKFKVDASDNPNTVTISIDSGKESDVAGYIIYYSKSEFTQVTSDLSKIEINLKDLVLSLSDEGLNLDIINIENKAKAEKSKKLYHLHSNILADKYLYVIDNLEPGTDYYFTVIAYDGYYNSIDTFKTECISTIDANA